MARRCSPVRWSRTFRQSEPVPKKWLRPARWRAGRPSRSWSVICFGAVSSAQRTRRSGMRARDPSIVAPALRRRSSASGTGISTPIRSRIPRAASSSRAAVAGPSRSQRGDSAGASRGVSRGSVNGPPLAWQRGRAPHGARCGGHTAPSCEGGGRSPERDSDLWPDSGPAGRPGVVAVRGESIASVQHRADPGGRERARVRERFGAHHPPLAARFGPRRRAEHRTERGLAQFLSRTGTLAHKGVESRQVIALLGIRSGRRGPQRPSAAASSLIRPGPTRQQPPTRRAPAATHRRAVATSTSGPEAGSQRPVPASHPSPEFG